LQLKKSQKVLSCLQKKHLQQYEAALQGQLSVAPYPPLQQAVKREGKKDSYPQNLTQ